ncbi:MAG: hypothetical protein KJ864_01140 [Candidatus Omnitrophica bacterium]|nr:hypothetical protein [Candidatus Omnitrophota bacterium]MBU1894418.1 hypothetical protein [Candidatus Omnitrophota bacterium]
MAKTFSVLMFGIITILAVNTSAADFEQYKWGDSFDNLKETVTQNKEKVLVVETRIQYDDTVFGKKGKVCLYFTSGTEQLAMVSVVWEEEFEPADKLKKIFESEYGTPQILKDYSEKYIWDKAGIRLTYAFGQTKVYYLGGKYYNEFERERRKGH